MPHPLVLMARQEYYFKSHIEEPLILEKVSQNEEYRFET